MPDHLKPDVSFTHGKKQYRLTGDCFKGLHGLTVLVNSAFEVNRSGIKIGNAHQV